jgi:hypothetical protein
MLQIDVSHYAELCPFLLKDIVQTTSETWMVAEDEMSKRGQC